MIARIGLLILFSLTLPDPRLSGQTRPLSEERREVLKFGIESEILDLVKTLKNEKDSRLNAELVGLLGITRRPALAQALLAYFEETAAPEAEEAASGLVRAWEAENQVSVYAAVKYLGVIKSRRAFDTIVLFLERTDRLASAAVAYLGRIVAADSAAGVLKLLSKKDSPTELKIEAVQALGDMRAGAGFEQLKKILEDADEDVFLRRKTCETLGRLKDTRAIPALKAAFDSADVMLRSSALAALAAIGGEGVEKLLVDGLRDSSFRVRLAAAEAAGERSGDDFSEVLIYKMKRDPERAVQRASIRSLAKAGGSRGVAYLKQVLLDEKAVMDHRQTAALELINFRCDEAVEALEKAAALEWKNEKSGLLELIARTASQKKESALDGLFERLLDHPLLTMKMYGLRGARLNKLSRLKPKISGFLDEKNPEILRRIAADVLGEL